MNAYASLARFYDMLTHDVPYSAIADFYESLFKKSGAQVKTVLDLACGTGTLTCLLAKRGFDMIGTDASPEMLSIAAEKSYELETGRPMFLNQAMESLDLYGTVEATVCSLDGINYVKPEHLAEVFRRVCLFLEPGGMFIFDIHTPSKLKSLDGEVFLDETEDVFCVWRTDFDESRNECLYGMDIFAREGGKWVRSREEHVEYAYVPSELVILLTNAGFVNVELYGDLADRSPNEEDKRIFIVAYHPDLT